jgi:hypothetical protein
MLAIRGTLPDLPNRGYGYSSWPSLEPHLRRTPSAIEGRTAQAASPNVCIQTASRPAVLLF